MRYQIIQTNTTTRVDACIDPLTGERKERTTTYNPGRVIAEHATKYTTDKHTARLISRFPEIQFRVEEHTNGKVSSNVG